MLLQSVKTGDVTPGVLFAAIMVHLKLFKEAYGDDYIRPKHHYCMHLPDMLKRFGFLLSTFTHERKHRIVKRHTRDRCNLTRWALGAIEEVTCHQIWELSLPFFMAFSESTPTGPVLNVLRELFPGVAGGSFTLHNNLKCNGGSASSGDVVSCLVDGVLHAGELLCTVGVRVEGGDASLWSCIALWDTATTAPLFKTDRAIGWWTMTVWDDYIVKVPTSDIDTVFTYRMSSDKKSCMLYLPYEVRENL